MCDDNVVRKIQISCWVVRNNKSQTQAWCRREISIPSAEQLTSLQLSGARKFDLKCTNLIGKLPKSSLQTASKLAASFMLAATSVPRGQCQTSGLRLQWRGNLRKERLSLSVDLIFCVRLGARPACQHEGDFVYEVGNVVRYVEGFSCAS